MVSDTNHDAQASILMEWAPLAIVRHPRAHLDPADAAKWFVASSSRRGHWHCYDSVDHTCACEAGQHGRDCKHARAFDAWAPSVAATARPRCADCGAPDVRADSRCGPCALALWQQQHARWQQLQQQPQQQHAAAVAEGLAVRPLAGAALRRLDARDGDAATAAALPLRGQGAVTR